MALDPEIRALGPDDGELLDCALVAAGRESMDAAAFLTDPRAHAFVALEGDRVLGWLYGYELPRPDGLSMMLLYDLEMDEDARRRGAGKALLEAFRDLAESRGHFKTWFYAYQDNEASRALAEEMGAETSGAPDHDYVWFFR